MSVLNGITLYAIGDSVFFGNGIGKSFSYPSLLAKKYNMNYVNDGVSGSTIAYFDGYPKNKIPMCLRWKNTFPSDVPDIILIEGGMNDRSRKIPIGSVDSCDIRTFLGAINTMLDEISKAYPGALIICITGWKRKDKWFADDVGTTQDYVDAMVLLCKTRNVPCIDASDVKKSHIDMTELEFRKKYCIAPDDTGHLNKQGMELIFPFIESTVFNLYKAHIKNQEMRAIHKRSSYDL